MFKCKKFTIIYGHYGCGKTNLSLNLALMLAREGNPVTLVDLDIVNPYFRSSDYKGLFEGLDVEVVSPQFAGTTSTCLLCRRKSIRFLTRPAGMS